MANTVSAAYSLKLKVTETIDLDVSNAEFTLVSANPTIDHEISGLSGTYNATSTPAVSKVWSGVSSLTDGAETIDLTSLLGQSGVAITMAGLKVQLLAIKNAGTSDMTFADGLTNGYHLFGDASGQITLGAGEACLFMFNEGLPDVGAAACEIDVTGTGTQSFHMIVVAG